MKTPSYLADVLKSPELRNTVWLLGGRIFSLALSFWVGVLLARYLGPASFGRLSFILATVAFMSPLVVLGLNAIVTKAIVVSRDSVDVTLSTAVFLRLLGGICALGLLWSASLVGEWFPDSDGVWLIALAAAEVTFALAVVDSWFQANVCSRYAVLSRSAVAGFGALAKVGLILATAKFGAFIVVYSLERVFTSLSLVAVFVKCSGKNIRWRFDRGVARKLLRESWWLIPSGLSAVIYLKLDQVMLGAMVGAEEVGLYAVAARVSEVWYFVPIAVVQSQFPRLLNQKSCDYVSYQTSLQRLFDALFWLAFSIALVVSFVASPLIRFVFGSFYESAGLILAIHVWAGVFIFMRAVLSKWMVAEELTQFSLVTHGLGALVNVAANSLLIPLYGAVGAAVATLISYAAASWLALFFSSKTRPIATMMARAPIAPLRYLKSIWS